MPIRLAGRVMAAVAFVQVVVAPRAMHVTQQASVFFVSRLVPRLAVLPVILMVVTGLVSQIVSLVLINKLNVPLTVVILDVLYHVCQTVLLVGHSVGLMAVAGNVVAFMLSHALKIPLAASMIQTIL